MSLAKKGNFAGPPDSQLRWFPLKVSSAIIKRNAGNTNGFGVEEYWIVDEVEEKVVFLRLNDKGNTGK